MAVRPTTKPRAKTVPVAKPRKPAARAAATIAVKAARPQASAARSMAATNGKATIPRGIAKKAAAPSAAKPVAKARAMATKVTRTPRRVSKPKPKA